MSVVLDEILGKTNLTYRQERGIIIIVPQEKSVMKKRRQEWRFIGKDTDEKGEPLSGVTVVIKGGFWNFNGC